MSKRNDTKRIQKSGMNCDLSLRPLRKNLHYSKPVTAYVIKPQPNQQFPQNTNSKQIFLEFLPKYNKDGNHATPAFIKTDQEQHYLQNIKFYQRDHERKLKQYSQTSNPHKIMYEPVPRSGYEYCNVCFCSYENYIEHVQSDKHKNSAKESRINRDIEELIDKVNGRQEKHNESKRTAAQYFEEGEYQDDAQIAEYINGQFGRKRIKSDNTIEIGTTNYNTFVSQLQTIQHPLWASPDGFYFIFPLTQNQILPHNLYCEKSLQEHQCQQSALEAHLQFNQQYPILQPLQYYEQPYQQNFQTPNQSQQPEVSPLFLPLEILTTNPQFIHEDYHFQQNQYPYMQPQNINPTIANPMIDWLKALGSTNIGQVSNINPSQVYNKQQLGYTQGYYYLCEYLPEHFFNQNYYNNQYSENEQKDINDHQNRYLYEGFCQSVPMNQTMQIYW